MRLQIYKYILAPPPFFSIFGSFPLKTSNLNLYVLNAIATLHLAKVNQYIFTMRLNSTTTKHQRPFNYKQIKLKSSFFQLINLVTVFIHS